MKIWNGFFHNILILCLKIICECLMLKECWEQYWTSPGGNTPQDGHLPPITKTIQVRRTRHAGHCWSSKDELISNVLLWTPTYGRAKAGISVLAERHDDDDECWIYRMKSIRGCNVHVSLRLCLWVIYSYGPPDMAGQKHDDQLEHTFSSYVRIRDVAL